MKRLFLFVMLACSLAAAQGGHTSAGAGAGAFSGGAGPTFQDVIESAAPANPAASTERVYADSTTHLLTCLTSGGGNCLPFLPLTGGTLTGNLLFTDNTVDIGAFGATRPRDEFLSRNLTVGGSITSGPGTPNDGTTVIGKLAKFTTLGVLTLATTADTTIPVFLITNQVASGGACAGGVCSWYADSGPANCTFDAGGVTDKNLVVNSTATNGDCMKQASGGYVIGEANATVGSGPGPITLTQGYNSSSGTGDMIKNAANTMGAAGTIDGSAMSATAGFKMPAAAGAIPVTANVWAYDSTENTPKIGNGSYTDNIYTIGPDVETYYEPWGTGNLCTGSTGTGGGGTMGWQASAVAGTNVLSCPAMVANHPGIQRLVTGGTNGNGGAISQLSATTAMTFDMSTNTNWSYVWIFRMNPVTAVTVTTSFYIGFMDAAGTLPPVRFIGLRFDTAATSPGADVGNFVFASCSASTCTTANSVAADNLWHRLRVWSTVSGTINYSLDGGATTCYNSGGTGGCTASANIPTVALGPLALVVTRATATREFDLDAFWFRWFNLSR